MHGLSRYTRTCRNPAQVFAYHEGRLAVAVVGGVFRPMGAPEEEGKPAAARRGTPAGLSPSPGGTAPGWRGVDAATVFMGYSVAKVCMSHLYLAPRTACMALRKARDSLACSVAKGLAAAAMLLLAGEGRLDFDVPAAEVSLLPLVAPYRLCGVLNDKTHLVAATKLWPALAAGRAGRDLTVAEAVSHRPRDPRPWTQGPDRSACYGVSV
jgi:hypothetical protein